ncbi:MAG: polysaccharide biosynthesis/export family protein [Cyclobacteriaceae bacterium]
MFNPTEDAKPEAFKREAVSTQKNYVLQKNDRLRLEIYSNNGERLIDPNPDMTGAVVKAQPKGQTSNSNEEQGNEQYSYLVDNNGLTKLPMIGDIKLEGLTLHQAEEIIQKEYSKFFKDPFVLLSYVNKRVIVLGAPGGHVIPLVNQNVTVAEILALAKGIDNNARADRIKLVRNNHVYQLDFSTIKGFTEGNMIVEPEDIIYVEPIRRPFSESLRDNYFLIYAFSSLITIILVNKLK